MLFGVSRNTILPSVRSSKPRVGQIRNNRRKQRIDKTILVGPKLATAVANKPDWNVRVQEYQAYHT